MHGHQDKSAVMYMYVLDGEANQLVICSSLATQAVVRDLHVLHTEVERTDWKFRR